LIIILAGTLILFAVTERVLPSLMVRRRRKNLKNLPTIFKLILVLDAEMLQNYMFRLIMILRSVEALNKYEHYEDFHKYKHNYDYQLALLMMGNKFYMTNGTILLSKNESVFTAVSQVNYEYYNKKEELEFLKNNTDVQCVIGHNATPFGMAQQPSLTDYADGTDTMQFAMSL
jgi:hypothetical protein